MSYYLYFLVIYFITVKLLYGQTSGYYDAKIALDIEKKEGIKVTDNNYFLLDSIIRSLDRQVQIPANYTKEEALNACLKISSVLEKEFNIKFVRTELLSGGLEKNEFDCNYYSIVFYTILNKKKNLPVFPVLVPGHMFIRWHLRNGSYFNYETTQNRETTDAEYDSIFNISSQAKANKVYMADINDKQFIAINYVEIANSFPDTLYVRKLELCEKSLLQDSNCVIAYLFKGKVLAFKMKFNSAIACFDKVLANDSLNYQTFNFVGLLYSIQGEGVKAIENYSKAIVCNPNDPVLYINRSEEYLKSEQLENAMNDFDSATDHLKKCSFFQFAENYIRIAVLEKAIMIEYLKQNGK